jgi:hypothetical protein
MVSNRLALAGLGLACVLAAAGGGYIAARQNAGVVPAQASPAPTDQAAESPATRAVEATEAVVSEPTPPARPEPERQPRPQPSRADDSPRRAEPPAVARNRSAEPQRPLPPIERTWPSGAASDPVPAPPPLPAETTAGTGVLVGGAADAAPIDTGQAPEALEKTFSELVVSAESVIGLQNETPLSSERARVEDDVEARVVRDVRVGSEVAIPAGSKALGSVMVVDRGGKFKERARLGVRFHTLVLADGTRLPITTETIYRYGDEQGNKSAAKVGGGAVAGAILGAIIGGAKGAAVGATAGAGGGTAAVMAGGRRVASLPVGAEVTARILAPVAVTVEK